MPRPRKYVRDPRTNQQVDGLSLHKATGQCYSLIQDGQRKHWGADLIRAIDDYRSSLKLHPFRKMTDRECIEQLVDESPEPGEFDEEAVTPEQIKRVKSKKLVVNNEWLATNPQTRLGIFLNTGKMPPEKEEPKPKINPDGIRTLKQAGMQWATDKIDNQPVKPRTTKDYLANWDEFVTIARRHSITDISQVDKDFIRKYRTKIKSKANGSENYYSNRFRRVKAILRHILTEHDVANVSDERAGYIRDSLRMLVAKVTKAPNRYVTKDELSALLAVCDNLAATNTTDLEEKLNQTKKGSSKYQSLVSQIRRTQERRFFGIQFRAIYLMAVNCMFYPVDISTIPIDAVNFDNGHVHFRRDKKDVVRVGLLLPATMSALKNWLKFRSDQSDKLFINSEFSSWQTKSLGCRIVDHRQIAGLVDEQTNEHLNQGTLTFKAFRKGGYRAALHDQRVDQYTAKILAGQQTGITDSYVDANPERCRWAVESIGKFYGLKRSSS